jgi:hypothetical protein
VALIKDRAEVASPDDRSGSGIPVARERDTPPQKPLCSPGKDLLALASTLHPSSWTGRVVGANVGVTVQQRWRLRTDGVLKKTVMPALRWRVLKLP